MGYLGPTVPGHQHDYTMLKDELAPQVGWFEGLEVYVDLGYLGIRTTYAAPHIHVPHRKPRKSANCPHPQLSDDQKADNRAFSRIRVLIENAIAGLKRYKIVVDRFRNHLTDTEDRAMATVTALWNFYLVSP